MSEAQGYDFHAQLFGPRDPSQLDRIEAKLDQVLALLTDEGAEDEQEEQRVVVATMDGKRHEVAASPSLSMSRDRGEGQKSGALSA